MKGIVFKEFSDMVEATFGEEMLDTVIENSDLPSGGVYTSDFKSQLERRVHRFCHRVF